MNTEMGVEYIILPESDNEFSAPHLEFSVTGPAFNDARENRTA
jgi:hypothetical protein